MTVVNATQHASCIEAGRSMADVWLCHLLRDEAMPELKPNQYFRISEEPQAVVYITQ
jgi:hypothetical protein